jgi:hypothetical protein
MTTGDNMNLLPRSKRGLELHRAEIDRLPPDLKAALAAGCTQRQTEVYRTFARRTGVRTSAEFDNLLRAIWDKIKNRQRLDPKEHMNWQRRAESLYPRDEVDDLLTGNAQIAVLALLHSNNVLWTQKAQDTCSAAHETFMSIRHFLTNAIGRTPQIDLGKPDATERIFAHSLIEAEHCRQERDLHEVQQALLQPNTIPAVVDELRRRSVVEAKNFLPTINGPRV